MFLCFGWREVGSLRLPTWKQGKAKVLSTFMVSIDFPAVLTDKGQIYLAGWRVNDWGCLEGESKVELEGLIRPLPRETLHGPVCGGQVTVVD